MMHYRDRSSERVRAVRMQKAAIADVVVLGNPNISDGLRSSILGVVHAMRVTGGALDPEIEYRRLKVQVDIHRLVQNGGMDAGLANSLLSLIDDGSGNAPQAASKPVGDVAKPQVAMKAARTSMAKVLSGGVVIGMPAPTFKGEAFTKMSGLPGMRQPDDVLKKMHDIGKGAGGDSDAAQRSQDYSTLISDAVPVALRKRLLAYRDSLAAATGAQRMLISKGARRRASAVDPLLSAGHNCGSGVAQAGCITIARRNFQLALAVPLRWPRRAPISVSLLGHPLSKVAS